VGVGLSSSTESLRRYVVVVRSRNISEAQPINVLGDYMVVESVNNCHVFVSNGVVESLSGDVFDTESRMADLADLACQDGHAPPASA
jgi:hypothetical protein